MNLTRADALASLKPNCEWTWDWDGKTDTRDYDKLTWLSSDTKPTEAEIDAELKKLNDIAERINKKIYIKKKPIIEL